MKGWQRKRPAFYITAMRSVGKPKCVEMERVDEKARNDGRGVNDMRKHGNGLEVGRAGTMEVKATKGAESTKAPKKQTGGDLRTGKGNK